MRKIAIFVMGLSLFLLTQKAYGLTWEYWGDYSGDVSTGLTVGAGNVGDPEEEWPGGIPVSQPIQISGAGTLLPSGYPGWMVNFHFNGSTWDSYNEEKDPDHTGYLDVFAAVLSEEGYYWNLANTNIHPLEDNSALILGLDPFHSTPGPDNSYWGGTSFDDGVREDNVSDVTLNFATDLTKQYHLTIFMQTMSDDKYPSWGTVTNLNVTAVPEPVSTILFLTGGTILVVRRLRRKK